jgi:hypothetical protein
VHHERVHVETLLPVRRRRDADAEVTESAGFISDGTDVSSSISGL